MLTQCYHNPAIYVRTYKGENTKLAHSFVLNLLMSQAPALVVELISAE